MNTSPLQDYSDEDLVDQVSRSTGGRGTTESANAELTYRLIKAIREAGFSTEDYSERLLRLSLVMALIALLQLIAAIMTIETSIWHKLALAVSAVLVVAYIFYDLFKDFQKKN